MAPFLAIQNLPDPAGDTQYAIAAVVVVAVVGLRFLEAVLGRYLPTKGRNRESPGEALDAQRDRDRCRRIDEHVHELREWHKPDGNGRQLWRNSDVVDLLREIRDLLKEDRRDRHRTDP